MLALLQRPPSLRLLGLSRSQSNKSNHARDLPKNSANARDYTDTNTRERDSVIEVVMDHRAITVVVARIEVGRFTEFV